MTSSNNDRSLRLWWQRIIWLAMVFAFYVLPVAAEPLPPRSSTIEPHDWQQTVQAVLWATGLLTFVMLMILREWRRARLRNTPPSDSTSTDTP